jgi:hypothetical protein
VPFQCRPCTHLYRPIAAQEHPARRTLPWTRDGPPTTKRRCPDDRRLTVPVALNLLTEGGDLRLAKLASTLGAPQVYDQLASERDIGDAPTAPSARLTAVDLPRTLDDARTRHPVRDSRDDEWPTRLNALIDREGHDRGGVPLGLWVRAGEQVDSVPELELESVCVVQLLLRSRELFERRSDGRILVVGGARRGRRLVLRRLLGHRGQQCLDPSGRKHALQRPGRCRPMPGSRWARQLSGSRVQPISRTTGGSSG